ncbi:oncostatin-M-specific receptor subunit beta-like isoform X1 [Saccostrea echinata]|uniref:oncostatin-M-specific receptor subunit beta-like isoform X1 n=1 Tax=Saccostrea echinata TaxID=191078 RepID=UPI002A820ADA|nr:oncostatin-M-specific receptor subunit beta-like isoform X1 [Saccostrea echinata]
MLLLSGLCTVFILLYTTQDSLGFMFQDGVVVPNDPYVYIGDDLVLSCNLTKPLDEDSKSMYFTRNRNEIIPSQYVSIVNSRSIKLRMPILSPEDSGNYICKINKTKGRTEVIGWQVVKVEYEPQRVNKDDINCRVFNWEKMNCTWKLGVDYLHMEDIKVELVWAVASDNKQYDCPQQTNTSCVWVSDNSKDRLRWNMPYSMGIIVKNEKTADQVITTFNQNTESIVQPDSVTDVDINPNSTCMNIQWNHSDKNNRKLYRVQYKSQWMEAAEEIETEKEFVVICNLKPHTWYTVEIQARPLTSRGKVTGFWSEVVANMELTKEDVPSGAPDVRLGSYAEYPCGLRFCRKIIVYWKPVKKDQSNGEILHYHVTLKDLQTGISIPRSIGNVTNHEFSVDINHAYEVQIRAATKVGTSEHSALVYIPSQNKEPEHPDEFLVERSNIDSDKEQIDISWQHPSSLGPATQIMSYTLFWCRGAHLIQNCQEPISWKTLHPNNTRHTIQVDKKSVHNMLFGISVEVRSPGSSSPNWTSSGIKWNNCIYEKNGKPLIAPKNFHLSPYSPETSIKVEWDPFQCHETAGYIRKYKINYCMAETSGNCTGDIFNVTVLGKEHSTVVHDLEPGSTYRFLMVAEAEGGFGPSTDPVYTTIPIAVLQTEKIVVIISIVLAVFALTLCGVIICIRRCYHTVKSNLQPYDIVIPNVPLPPVKVPASMQESSFLEPDFPVPFIPTKPSLKSKEPRDKDDDDDDDSIYAKINEPDSRPSSPGDGAANVPLLIKSNDNSSQVKAQTFDDGVNLFKNNVYLADSIRSGVMNSAETLLCRLHPSHIAMYSYNGGKLLPKVKNMAPEEMNPISKNRTIDTAALAACSPYGCVDVTGKAYSEKDLCTHSLTHSVAPRTCDSHNLTNDLSGSSLGRNGHVINSATDASENYNIRLTLDRRKKPENFTENNIPFNLHNSCVGDERFHVNNLEDTFDMNESNYLLDSSQSYPITSYCKAEPDPNLLMEPKFSNDLNIPRSGMSGYVDYNQYNIQSGIPPMTDYVTTSASERLMRNSKGSGNQLNVMAGTRPVSEVITVPPHFYGSLSLLDDDGEVTEL